MKKGQAAMEFLMTYGWAILLVLAAIAALAYFGVLDMSKFAGDRCLVSAPYTCNDYKADPTGVTLKLYNAGEDLAYAKIDMEQCGSIETVTVTKHGELIGGLFNCTLTSGSKFKAKFNVTYMGATDTLNKSTVGTVITKVE